ncbi:MAG: cardiolipin synthase [Proteobacteria bacterium]|nr:MAG: cardiolipin synthase [Pseudomonadota bacterium]PIE40091.1 MAG: cardiolipin synthase [Gammaproteobacteria bacterium]
MEQQAFLFFFLAFIYLLAALTIIRVLLHYRTPQAAIAWILALALLPFVALPAYLLIGPNKFRGYRDARKAGDRDLGKLVNRFAERYTPASGYDDQGLDSLARLSQLGRLPVTVNNRCQLLVDGEQALSTMFKSIERAQRYILLEFYIINGDSTGFKLKEILIARARLGVNIFMLYDDIGSSGLNARYIKELKRHGIDARPFGSIKKYLKKMQINFRNHRKVLIVDGKVGFTGGINIGDEYLGQAKNLQPWRDTHIQIEGPSVLALQLVFLEDWNWVTHRIPTLNWRAEQYNEEQCNKGQLDDNRCNESRSSKNSHPVLILPTGPADDQDTSELFFLSAINRAQHKIWIATPYFVPDASILRALQLATIRGVDVRILIPAIPDHRVIYYATHSFLEEADQSGIKIFAYQRGFMHQKVLLVDSLYACINTANLDARSLRLNFEVNTVVASSPFTAQVEHMLIRDFQYARRLTGRLHRAKPLFFRLACRTARLFSPVL